MLSPRQAAAPIRRLDTAIVRVAGRLAGRSQPFDAAMAAAARHLAPAEVGLLVLLFIGGPGRRGDRRRLAAVRAGSALALTLVAIDLAGRLIQRSRPFAAQADVTALVEHAPHRSFPSRHVACAAAMATATLPAAPTIGRAMAALGALLSMSRVYAGLHYPSDVLAGWLLGIGAGRLARLALPDNAVDARWSQVSWRARPARRHGQCPDPIGRR